MAEIEKTDNTKQGWRETGALRHHMWYKWYVYFGEMFDSFLHS